MGFKALAALNLKYLKDLSTINQQILGNVVTGKEEESKRILTTKEEESVATYLVNRNHAMLKSQHPSSSSATTKQ